MLKRPLISVSIPVLNEESNVERLYCRVCALADKMKDRCDFEFVFSDNHSSDNTWNILRQLSQSDDRVKGIRFSRDVGYQRSILANYIHTKGDAILQVDADMQDPPELLEVFFEHWKNGYHVVYGIRKKRNENIFLQGFRRIGYWFVDKISESRIPQNAGDFRMIDRKVLNVIEKTKNRSPYLRGMIAGLGFNQIGVEYDRDARMAGKSKFNIKRILSLGLVAVFNHSTLPLRLSSFLGFFALLFSILLGIYYLFLYFTQPDLPRGFLSIQVLMLIAIGMNALFLGIIGEYILKMYKMLCADPVAVVESSLNFSHDELKM